MFESRLNLSLALFTPTISDNSNYRLITVNLTYYPIHKIEFPLSLLSQTDLSKYVCAWFEEKSSNEIAFTNKSPSNYVSIHFKKKTRNFQSSFRIQYMNDNIENPLLWNISYIFEKFEKIEGESFRFSSQTSQNTYFA